MSLVEVVHPRGACKLNLSQLPSEPLHVPRWRLVSGLSLHGSLCTPRLSELHSPLSLHVTRPVRPLDSDPSALTQLAGQRDQPSSEEESPSWLAESCGPKPTGRMACSALPRRSRDLHRVTMEVRSSSLSSLSNMTVPGPGLPMRLALHPSRTPARHRQCTCAFFVAGRRRLNRPYRPPVT